MKKVYMHLLNKTLLVVAVLFLPGYFYNTQAQLPNESFRVKRGERPSIDYQSMPSDAYEQGILLIKFKPEYTEHLEQNPAIQLSDGSIRFNLAAVDNLNDIFGAQSFKQHFLSQSLKNTFTPRHKAWGFHLWYRLVFDPASDIKTIIGQYQALDEIEIAEPEFRKALVSDSGLTAGDNPGALLLNPAPSWVPNDPQLGQQWHYNNTGQTGGTPGADISLFEAWDIEKGNINVIVAVVDGGIAFSHPDIAANMWENIGYNFVSGSSTVVPHNHGTHVAGTVAAVNNNNVGVAGVAGGSGSGDGVRLMSCQVFTASGSGGFHLAPVYAADNGASISQNSWTYTSAGYYDQNVLDAIDYFNVNGGGDAMADGGITIFAAANYNSSNNYYPAFYSGTMAVAATTHTDTKAYYSNFGTWVDISAPGGETISVTSQGVLSTLITNYDFYQGTSMACPHVSGVAALIISHVFGQLNAEDLAEILMNSVDDHYAVNPNFIGMLGSGRLNAHAALLEAQAYLTGILNPSNFSATALSAEEVELSWNKNDNNNEVLLAWSLTSNFGVPDSGMIYQPGDVLPGGGTVLYHGGDTGFLHTGLEGTTMYYYRIWSVTDSLQYSSGRSASAATSCQVFQLPFTENFGSLSLECWSFPEGQGNWNFGSSYTPPSSTSGAPNAFFNWSPSLTNYSHSLTSPVIDASNMAEVQLDYILFINSYSGSTIENMAVEYKTLDATEWTLLELFTTAGLGSGNAEYIRNDQALEGMAGTQFQVQFRAYGPNSFNINGWGLDDIHIHGESMPDLPGDSNCDGEINVLDAITTVNYIMGNNPEPFCWDNADVTQDGIINVLDIIGTVNIILSGNKTSPFEINSSAAHIFMNREGIALESDGTLAGLQFEITGTSAGNLNFLLNGFEFVATEKDNKVLGLIFSFNNTPIPAGRINLFSFGAEETNANWGEVIAGNLNAEKVTISRHVAQNDELRPSAAEINVFPNPSAGIFTIQTSEPLNYQILDMKGRMIETNMLNAGSHNIDLTGKAKGLYFLRIQGIAETATHRLIVK
ncbi:MAG TPA: T9SS type A sorting domain-containing protein [Bacteroidales bacterium]|nr:T9SS type A sorting domain-containing protein [Bacteroidales bacterium]